jgi:hypothetical protein
MGLSMAGIVFLHSGGNKEIGELIAKGRERFNREYILQYAPTSHYDLQPLIWKSL